jgi:hypothetical protein
MKLHLYPQQGQDWRWVLLRHQLQLSVLNDVNDGIVLPWGKGPKDSS